MEIDSLASRSLTRGRSVNLVNWQRPTCPGGGAGGFSWDGVDDPAGVRRQRMMKLVKDGGGSVIGLHSAFGHCAAPAQPATRRCRIAHPPASPGRRFST